MVSAGVLKISGRHFLIISEGTSPVSFQAVEVQSTTGLAISERFPGGRRPLRAAEHLVALHAAGQPGGGEPLSLGKMMDLGEFHHDLTRTETHR